MTDIGLLGGNIHDYLKTQVADYKFDKTSKMESFVIRPLTYVDLNYLDLSSHKIYHKAVT